ncbi:hypothetical protein [Plantactinospora sp. KLBMP9567]|uniref:hypothetical protein n=1 Tax=Plantactinospora sp. KLBMP9567 TaxID=3085900 RepID=UPI0029825115|nr:hypothetical protein [Plantactinospora sp. KLBMP9567]MDW5327525.1 hypothetical protein [Plantactinospora sp. KLBMP9567]
MTDAVSSSLADAVSSSSTAVIDLIDGYMHRVLKGREDPVGVVEELKCALVDLLLTDDVVNVAALYSIYADLSDIVDGYPFHYDDGTEMIAQREIRDAAWEWLSIARNADGMKTYVDRWAARIAALPTTDGGRPFRGDSGRLEGE